MSGVAATGRFPFRHLTLAEVREWEKLSRLRLERYGPRWARYLQLRARKIILPDESDVGPA